MTVCKKKISYPMVTINGAEGRTYTYTSDQEDLYSKS